MRCLTVVGDSILDRDVEGVVQRLAPDAPVPVLEEREVRSRPGGAGLAALLAARDGHDVTLVTALADDPAGRELESLLASAGVDVVDLGLAGATCEKIRLQTDGTSLARWDRGDRTTAEDVGEWSPAADAAVRTADAVLVSCYGRGVSSAPDVRSALERVARPLVWDPHPRGARPVRTTLVATPNESELRAHVPHIEGDGLEALVARADDLLRRWGIGGLAVTRGARGAVFSRGDGMPLAVPATAAVAGDTCGAGDRFAASLTGALADGGVPSEAVDGAVNAATAFVAAGGAGAVRVAAPDRSATGAERTAFDVVARVRADGGTVVATGGCFDLVHAGHVQVLEAARALGDCLVVFLNSDRSVQRLKGEGRPIVPQEDRVALLRALSSVDEVVVFDEDTPVEALRRIRPDVFAKGGDYGTTRIPEMDVVAEWGGQVVTLPYLAGRSTSSILQEVARREN
jgi:D-beta-D-heptose 7-phosphate kinase / D-beta-D-heptose 1-phosphate adenosyltransferase